MQHTRTAEARGHQEQHAPGSKKEASSASTASLTRTYSSLVQYLVPYTISYLYQTQNYIASVRLTRSSIANYHVASHSITQSVNIQLSLPALFNKC